MTRPAALLCALAACGPTTALQSPADCASCHTAVVDAWQQSSHGRGPTPTFTALLPRVEAAWGRTAKAQCVACHQPDHDDSGAIGCASCHLAIGNREEQNAALVIAPNAPLAGPTAGPAPHPTARRAFFDAPSLCGTCHEVQTAHLVEPTFSEYRQSAWRNRETCVSCHHDGHRSPGFAVDLLARALTLEVTPQEVRLTNVGAGHDVPTGQIALRELWVEVTLVDGQRLRPIDLGAVPLRHGEPVTLFTDATEVRSRSLASGASRVWVAPATSQILEARLWARRVRPEVSEALGLAVQAPLEVRRVMP